MKAVTAVASAGVLRGETPFNRRCGKGTKETEPSSKEVKEETEKVKKNKG